MRNGGWCDLPEKDWGQTFSANLGPQPDIEPTERCASEGLPAEGARAQGKAGARQAFYCAERYAETDAGPEAAWLGSITTERISRRAA